jgi:transcriptional regulator with XRE-family HTH domain
MRPVTQSVFTERYARLRQVLRDTRKRRGLTQAKLAQRLGRPQSFVSKYERGERRLDLVEFLEVAEAIGVDPRKVLDALRKA